MREMDLKREIEKAQARAQRATYMEAKKEFSEEAYPMLLAFYEEYMERMDDLEGTVAELIGQTGSYLQPNLSDQIMATLEIGKKLASDVAAYLETAQIDDLTKRELAEDVAAYLTAAQITEVAVTEITSAPEEEGDEEEEVEEDEEDEEGDEEETETEGEDK